MSDPTTPSALQGLSLSELVQRAREGRLAGLTLAPSATSLVHPAPGLAASSPAPGAGLALNAPAGSPLAVELIRARDLSALAARLMRSKSEFKQTTGRALLKAISGELWAPKGYRNQTAYQIAAECVEAYPNLDPASAVQCFSAAISNAQSIGSKMTAATWAGALTRVQNERQLRLNMIAQVAPSLSATGKALESAAKQVAQSTWGAPDPAGSFPAIQYPSGAAQPASNPVDVLSSVVHSLIILADGTYYLRLPHETHYPFALKSGTALRVELARQFGCQNQTVITHDDKGKNLPVDELLQLYGSNARKIVYDYSSERTTWDEPSSTLQVGFPSEPPAMHPDRAVHDWLCVLAAEREDSETCITDLYDWIAACQRKYIDHPSTALCIVGPPNAGKGVLTLALAATWGVLPVKLANCTERFNGALLSSPIWHADERTPEGLTDDLFRTIVQERVRLIEPKGREKVELRGCGRMVFTLNHPNDFKVGSIAGPEALQAVADRVSFFDCRGSEGALALTMAPLMLPNGDMDLARIVKHLRWVQTQYTPRAQRFLGARADRTRTNDFVIQQIAAHHTDVYELLIDYLTNPGYWEAQYHADRRTFPDGYRYPLVTAFGGLWVFQTEFALRFGTGKDVRAVRAALSVISSGGKGEISFGNKRLRANYIEIDLDKLLIAANVLPGSDTWNAIVKTVSVETRVRAPGLA